MVAHSTHSGNKDAVATSDNASSSSVQTFKQFYTLHM